ncbi:hypothetical protein [Streptomyces sp. NPDC000410]|uniref:hypothetical protein n=1 Tax=Streptomyces sp. NPDC000410 TaxID=3154254 RepID=UPI0033325F1D
MAWDEWEQAKTAAANRSETDRMRLNQLPAEDKPSSGPGGGSGDLVVHDDVLGALGDMARSLRDQELQDLLDETRVEAIGKEFADDKDQRKLELEKQGEWRKFAAGAVTGAGIGIGVATAMIVPTGGAALIAVPIAIETVGGAANAAVAANTLQWIKDNELDNRDEALTGIAKAREDGTNNAMIPLINYKEAQGMTATEFRTWRAATESAYNNGGKLSDTSDAG